uniref:protein-serine/threonine phosphatase n=1 Tax=Ditylum brightwellii TaxID=49249 RepID=A0A7S2E4X6_9STRA|mmetsp:Transcript_13462/g.20064  ORF Transcript_13462/g.20064 Transcript_13462/m.20064 type:complete len:549 (+) Transcript_13462:82-1728(+)
MGNAQDRLAEPITEKDTERGQCLHVSRKYDTAADGTESTSVPYAASGMQGWRTSMEDQHIMLPSIKLTTTGQDGKSKITFLEDHAFFAVFDGHGGGFTSKYSEENMVRHLTNQELWGKYLDLLPSSLDAQGGGRDDVPGIQLLKEILIGAFLDLDEELESMHLKKVEEANRLQEEALAKREKAAQESSTASLNSFARTTIMQKTQDMLPRIRLDRSGSTCVCVLLTPTHIICANAGDSRGVLCRNDIALPLSFDHKPQNPLELSRIQAAGGFVRMKRVDGDLAVSRGLGDFTFKNRRDLPSDQQKVIAKPDILTYPRRVEEDEFVVLACDGVWDVLDNQDVVNHVQTILDEGETDIGLVCEEMLDTCIRLDSRDNMTFAIVGLPAIRIRESSNGGKAVGVKARRADRGSKPSYLTSSAVTKRAVAQCAIDGGVSMTGKPIRVVKKKGLHPSSSPTKARASLSPSRRVTSPSRRKKELGIRTVRSGHESPKKSRNLSRAYNQSAQFVTELTTEVEVTHKEFERSMSVQASYNEKFFEKRSEEAIEQARQ